MLSTSHSSKPFPSETRRVQWPKAAIWLVCFCAMTPGLARAENTASSGPEETFAFDFAAGPLAASLDNFATTTGWQIGYSAALAQGRESSPVIGDLPAALALEQLLEGTGLTFEPGGTDDTVILVPLPEPPPTEWAGMSSVHLMPAFTVLGTLDGRGRIYDEAAGTAVVDREAIDRTGARHASEILQATAGVLTATNEQNPSVSVNIRGLKDFGRVNMNIDGMRQNYQRSGHGQRNGEMFFDTEFLSEVQVEKGVHAGAGGAGVTGGVATFSTLEATDVLQNGARFGGRLRASSGLGEWANGQNLSGSLMLATQPTSNTDLLLGYSLKDSDAYRPGQSGQAVYWGQSGDVYADTSTNIVNASGQTMASWLASGNWFIGDALSLKLTALGADMEYGESQTINTSQLEEAGYYDQYCDPPINDYWAEHELCQTPVSTDDEALYPVSNTNHTTTQSYAIDANYAPGGDAIDLAAKLYHVNTRNVSSSNLNQYSLITRTDTLGGLLKNRSVLEVGEHWFDVDYGVEVFVDENRPDVDSYDLTAEQSDALADGTPHGQRLLTGTWLAADWEYRRLTLSPAIRWETYRLWGETGFNETDDRPDSPTYGKPLWRFQEIDVDRNDAAWLPSLGAAYAVVDTNAAWVQVFANTGLSWRPPQITETLTSSAVPFHNPPVRTLPNWQLEPEKTYSWEAGFNASLDGDESRFNLKLNQFYNRTENYIDQMMFISTPGDVSHPSLSSPSAYANAINDRVFQGQELQIDVKYQRFYGGLNVTHTEQGADPDYHDQSGVLMFPAWPLGGPDDEDPLTYCPDAQGHYEGNTADGVCAASGNLYAPPVPEWTGRLTLGTRLFQRRADLGVVLTCASQTGDYAYQDTSDFGQKIGLAEYCALDHYASHEWDNGLRLGYHLKNVTDREYIQAMGDGVVKTYAPGRTLTANLQWTF